MTRLLLALLLVAIPMQMAVAICRLPPPRTEPEIELPPPAPPPPPPNFSTPTAPNGPPTPAPTTPGETTKRPTTRPGARTRGRSAGADYQRSWHLWWELNREALLGLRGTLRGRTVLSGGEGAAELARAERAERLDRAQRILRTVARKANRPDLRAAALRAIGRAGNDEDARILVGVLTSKGQPDEIYEGAALGLGCLPPIESAEIRSGVRELHSNLIRGRCWPRGRSRRLAVMALSIRAQQDPALGWALGDALARKVDSANDASALLYSCGLAGDPLLLPALMEAVRTGEVGGRRLHDVARSHAALALARTGESAAVPVLAKLLKSRKTGIHTRRGSAIALGLMLRDDKLSGDARDHARAALEKGLDSGRDPLVRGFCAVGMGAASEPFGLERLTVALDDKGLASARPFVALSLGLAAWRLDGRGADGIRTLLAERLVEEREVQVVAALSIAAGLAKSKASQEALFARLESKRLDPAVRGPAIQGLGLLRERNPRIEKTLVRALDEGSDEVVEDAALALGLLGTRSTALLLVDKLARTRSESVQAHMVAALSHLGAASAVDPLLELVEDTSLKPSIRRAAITALGILLDDRDSDILFEIDAHTNPYALTPATRALVLPY